MSLVGSYQELQDAADIYNEANSDWIGMHCVSSYPCPLEMINLPKLLSLQDFVETLGLSDHTSETVTPALSLSYGVKVIEKHFTSDNDLLEETTSLLIQKIPGNGYSY